MDLQESRQGAVTVLKPMGPIVLGDADQFRAAATDAHARSLGRYVVDASSVAYVDSQGLEALLDASEALATGGQCMRLCGANETLREVLELTGLSDSFEHYEDVNAAARSFL